MLRWLTMGVLTFVALAYVVREPLLQATGDFLVVNDPLVRADAVIAISGNGPERVATSVGLLRAGYGRWLIVSGGPYGYGHNSAVPMREQAMAFNVPAERILVDDRADSTFDNAAGSMRLMKTRGLRTAILVTSPYHTRRAALVFSRVFRSEGMDVRVRSVEDSFFEVRRWWTRHQDRNLVIREYAKLVVFLGGAR